MWHLYIFHMPAWVLFLFCIVFILFILLLSPFFPPKFGDVFYDQSYSITLVYICNSSMVTLIDFLTNCLVASKNLMRTCCKEVDKHYPADIM